jgi:ribosomal protein L37AE/L43A
VKDENEPLCPKCSEPLKYAWVGIAERHMWVCYSCHVKLDEADLPSRPGAAAKRRESEAS